MKLKVLLLILVLIVVALLVFLGNPINLFNNEEKESSSRPAQEIWIPDDHSQAGMDIVREHIRDVEKQLEAMSGPLTNETFKLISDFFRHRGFIITHDNHLLRGEPIPGYLKSNWQHIDEINFELAYFVSEEFVKIWNLRPGPASDVTHVVHLGFRVSYVYDGEPTDPGGGRVDRHIRDCTWGEPGG